MICPKCGCELTKGKKAWFCEDCDYKQPIGKIIGLDADELFYKDAFNSYYPLLAHEYHVLYSFMKEKNYFGALLEYKDVVEIVLKFPTLIAINHLWRKDSYELREEKIIIELLLGKPLSLGDWKAICGFFNKLYGIKELKDYDLAAKLKPLLDKVNKFFEKGNIVRWRNETIGHGALQTNLESDAEFLSDFTERLKALKSHLEDNRLLYEQIEVLDASNKELRGKGCEEQIKDTLRIKLGGVEYEQEPFILIKDKTTSIFDSYVKDSVYVLNYITGSKESHGFADEFAEKRRKYLSNKQLTELEQSGSRLTDKAFNSEKIEILSKISDEKEAFTDPEYIIEDIKKFIEDSNGGILFLQMERGMGKTTLVRALDQLGMGNVRLDDGQNNMAIRAYYINNMFSYRINHFQNETENIFANAKNFDIERLTFSNIKTNFIDAEDMSAEFARFLNDMLDVYQDQINTVQKLLYIIDGLDEIRHDEKEKRAIFDCIPHSEKLAEGVYIILTGRHKTETAQWINEKYAVIESKAVLTKEYSRSEKHNTRTLENYLSKQLYRKKTAELEADEAKKVKTVIEKGDHRFLYVKALRELLKVDNFDIDEISDENIMERYLKVLESRYGAGKYYEKIKRLLLITALLDEPAAIEELSYLFSFEPADFKFIGYLTDLKGLLHIDRTGIGETISASVGAMHDDWKKYLVNGNKDMVQDIIEGWINETNDKVKSYKKEDTTVFVNITDGESYLIANIYSLTDVYLPEAKSFFSDEDVRDFMSSFASVIAADNTIISTERAIKIYTGIITVIETQNEPFDEDVLAGFYFERGDCHRNLQSLEKAITDFNKCAEILECLQNEGKQFDENDLATVYNDRGVTYISMIEYDKAIKDLDGCIEIWERLRNKGELDDENSLSLAYNNYGLILNFKTDYNKAIAEFDKGIEILERLRDNNEYYEESYLAMNYLNKGLAYNNMTEYDKAIAENDKCIKIWEKMREEGKFFDINSLATAYLNKGMAYITITEYEKGMVENDKCVKIWERMQEEGKLFDINNLAKAYLNRGTVYISTIEYDNAVTENDRCIEIWEKMQNEEKLFDKNNLAMAYMNRGYAYNLLNENEKSIVDYNQCIEIWEKIQDEGRLFEKDKLATAYLNKSLVYIANNENENAIAEIDRCIELCERIQNEEKLFDKNNMAKAYLNKGVAYDSMEEYDKSITENEKCIKIWENLRIEGKFFDKNYLAIAYKNRADTYINITEYDKAITYYDKCIEILEQLYKEKKLIYKNNLIEAYYKRANTYNNIPEYEKAIADYNRCIKITEIFINEDELFDESDLIDVYFNRANTFNSMGKYKKAIADFDRCLEILKRLLDKNELYDEDGIAKVYKNRGLSFFSMEEYDNAMADFDRCIKIWERLSNNDEFYNEYILAGTYYNRANTYDSMEEYEKAITDYNKCIEILERLSNEEESFEESDLVDVYFDRGKTYTSMEEYGKAVTDYNRCLEIMERSNITEELYDDEDFSAVNENKKAAMDAMKAK